MTELVNRANERSNDATACVISLLHHYGFDLGGYTIAQLLLNWQEHYSAAWMRLATVEALYQGRYKAISVEQILALWQRRSQPIYHFNHEFERLVCDKLPEDQVLSAPSPQNDPLTARSTALAIKLPYHSVALQLPSFGKVASPETDVMLALRTLHSAEMAVLTDAQNAAEAQPTEASSSTDARINTEAVEQPRQTYSYNLRSDEQSASPSPHHDDKGSAQDDVNQTTPLLEAIDANASTVSDGAFQDESVAPQSHQPEHEQPHAAEHTDSPAARALPPGDIQARSSLSQVGSIAKILQQLDYQEPNAKTAFPGLGLMAPTLKPPQRHLTTHYQPIWLTDVSSKQPIHQFTPPPELPDFYSKLNAIDSPLKPGDDALHQ